MRWHRSSKMFLESSTWEKLLNMKRDALKSTERFLQANYFSNSWQNFIIKNLVKFLGCYKTVAPDAQFGVRKEKPN